MSSPTTSGGHMLGNTRLPSHLPVPNRPRTRTYRRTFLAVVPFAPLIDTHAFQPPPPYSAHPDDSAECLPVPHNTPEEPARMTMPDRARSTLSGGQTVGLGLEGVEKSDGARFDGLGQLSGGFRACAHDACGTSDALRQQVRQMLNAQRRRVRANEQPAKHQDVFYAAVDVTHERARPRVNIRIRRKSAASPTPGPRWEVGTISSELKRAASLARRSSSSRPWRV